MKSLKLADSLLIRKVKLLEYSLSEIQSTLNGKVTGGFSASLNYFLADATELKDNISIESFPLAVSWDNGLGKYYDDPVYQCPPPAAAPVLLPEKEPVVKLG